jgi:DNA-binding response OmpR family regulator
MQRSEPHQTGRHDILVVDDEGPILEMVVELLGDEGYDVRMARNVEAARSAIQMRQPDLLLIDARLPGVDGVTFLQTLRDEGYARFPCILMTADSELIRTQPQAANDYLAKPFEINELLAMVARHLADQGEGA